MPLTRQEYKKLYHLFDFTKDDFNDNPKITYLEISPHQLNWNFEVISKQIAHDMFDFYSIDHAQQNGFTVDQLDIFEDEFPEYTKHLFQFAKHPKEKVNHYAAKAANLGVVRGLKDQLKDREFLYLLNEADMEISILQLAIYGYLAHGYIDKRMVKAIKNDEGYRFYISTFPEGAKMVKKIMGE